VTVVFGSIAVEPAAPAGSADEGKNYLSQPRSNQAGPAADFIDSIDPKRTSAVRALRVLARTSTCQAGPQVAHP
jgi:hypothetical protein